MALLALVLAAFFTGRKVEETALVAKANRNGPPKVPSAAASTPAPPTYRQLAVAEILAQPFGDFYEALRSAPAEAREKWATQLMQVPDGPRRRAAVSGFYKLLIQFDPEAAVKAISEIGDARTQELALASAVNATPGFALPLVADLALRLEGRLTAKRDYLYDILSEWMAIDPPTVARFIEEHTEAQDPYNHAERSFVGREVVAAWAALDPKEAKQWVDQKGKWEGWSEYRQAFIEGWYENDREAAVSYVLAHSQEREMDEAIGSTVLFLYGDSKEEAAKFIESLPGDKRADAIEMAFHSVIMGDEEETGDTAATTRAVASWVIEFPPAYWNGTLGRLFRFSATDMLPWIEQLPPAIREAVAAEYEPPMGISASDAIISVLRVPDPVFRDQLVRAVAKNRVVNFDEAGTVIAAAPLSDEQKNHLRQIIAAAEAEKKDQDSEK